MLVPANMLVSTNVLVSTNLKADVMEFIKRKDVCTKKELRANFTSEDYRSVNRVLVRLVKAGKIKLGKKDVHCL